MKILVIPDKFKGTLTAAQAANAIAEGWRSVRPTDDLLLLPMSDGGDGFGAIIGGMLGLIPQEIETVDSAGRPLTAPFWAGNGEAIVEAAQVNGLALLPPGKFHPFELDTFGLGALIAKAASLAKRITIGIGGSSTNDGGFGLARALGWKFFANSGAEITRWIDLESLQTIIPPAEPYRLDVQVAVDVQNPLLGPNGASHIYGPQKGLRPEDMQKAEACLGRLGQVANSTFRADFASEPGAGAAGGLGFGLRAFLRGRFVSGAEIFARAAKLDERLEEADVVISGEGAIDAQSLMGKGVGEIFARCRKRGVKRIGLAGILSPNVFTNDPDLTLMSIVPSLTTIEEAKREPARWLRALAAQCAKAIEPAGRNSSQAPAAQ